MAKKAIVHQAIEQAIKRNKKRGIDLPDEGCIYDVVWTHDQIGYNYVWLHPHYGKVLWIDFEEPIGSGNWRTYNRYWWTQHASLVSHDPETLVKDHVKWYVNPKTKTINLRFWFELPNGEVYSMAPTKHFYELERDYFNTHKICMDYKIDEFDSASEGPNYLYNKD